jgi:hypothetical protein
MAGSHQGFRGGLVPLPQGGKVTAEIAIMNRQGIALAADSAVTVGRERVWKHANKMFSLGPNCDIGIMIYNSGDFIGLPWEVIIKEFRRPNCTGSFGTVAECCDAFLSYVAGSHFRSEIFERVSSDLIFIDISENVSKKLRNLSSAKEKLHKIESIIDSDEASLAENEEIGFTYSFNAFKKRHATHIRELARDIWKCRVPKALMDKYIAHFYSYYMRKTYSEYHTGIVVAGFGRSELFPCVCHAVVDGKDDGVTTAWKLGTRDFNDPKSETQALIIPFAQKDVFAMFMEGTIPAVTTFVSKVLKLTLDEKSENLVKSYIADGDEQKSSLPSKRRII